MDFVPLQERAATEREAGAICPHCERAVRRGDAIHLCTACSSVHHQGCWRLRPTCGAYVCAPARRDLTTSTGPVMRLSDAEIECVAPLPPPRPRIAAEALPLMEPRRLSNLALSSFVCALAGVLLFGLITGPVAVLLGILAMGPIHTRRLRGLGLAVAGILLGLVDTVVWIVLLVYTFGTPEAGPPPTTLRLDRTALEGLDAPLARAMRANVLLEHKAGWMGRQLGSGVLMRITPREAIILTNRHVVDAKFRGQARDPDPERLAEMNIRVELVDQSTQEGKVTWIAPGGIDLALVRIAPPGEACRSASWEPGRKARIGAGAFAIGNPHGLGWTHTQGVISQFRLQELGGREIRLIQTQTVINPGNSGGGLYDQEGYLIGINTWTRDRRDSEGLNFAIDLETLWPLAPPGLDPEAAAGEVR